MIYSILSIFSFLIRSLYRLCIVYVNKISGEQNKTLPRNTNSFQITKKEYRSFLAKKYFYDCHLIVLIDTNHVVKKVNSFFEKLAGQINVAEDCDAPSITKIRNLLHIKLLVFETLKILFFATS